MKILVTNDDGYTSIGLKKLVEKLKEYYTDSKIVVIAPKTQKSATSHSIILKGNIEFKKVEDIVEGIETYYCDGNPADCTSFARCVLKFPYDLVVSGCNNGINLGYDIIYSGTVAGASDGLIDGKKGLAVSCKVGEFNSLEHFKSVLEYIYQNNLFEKTDLLNVNLVNDPKGIKLTKMGKSFYGAYYDQNEDGTYTPRMGVVEPDKNNDETTDWHAFSTGYISITPLTIDSTDYNMLKEYKK